MRRREFIGLLGSTAAWPITARAQLDRMRRVGVLMPYSKENPQAQARIAAFLQELQRLGWTTDHNLQIEYRWDTGEPNSNQKAAMELVALSPDVILATATPVMVALQQTTHTVPIVFVQVADPVSAGFITSLAKPGGNATGFTNIEYEIGAKWLELLKEIAPQVTRVGVIRDPFVTASIGQYGAIQSVARSFGVELSPLGGQDASAIERTVTEFAQGSNCGLIVLAVPLTINNHDLIILWPPDTAYQQRTRIAISSRTVALFLLDLTRSTHIGTLRATSIASSRVRSPLTSRCKDRPNTSLRSTLRPPRHSTSLWRIHSSPARLS
jgi:putative ABC transport system substrate-binding protein